MPASALFDLVARPGLKSSFAPQAIAAAPPPLLLDAPGICDPWIATAHAAAAGPVASLGCYTLTGATITGACHVLVDDAPVVASDLTPHYLHRALQAGVMPGRRDLPIRSVAHPLAVIATPGYLEYGHWLLDILPRLWTLAESPSATPAHSADGPRIALPSDTPPFGLALLDRLGIPPARLLLHDPAAERLAPPSVLLPSLAHTDYRFHPAACGYYDRLVANHAAPAADRPTRLFLSRAQYSRPDVPGRHLVNHHAVRTLTEACGLTTIFPERLSWPEQLALFAGARVVVGEHGSAMKNLLFTPPGAAVVNIHWLNNTQSRIAALRRHHLIYLRAEELRLDDAGRLAYRVDIATLARCVLAALDQAGRP